jgi:hypothetical protein
MAKYINKMATRIEIAVRSRCNLVERLESELKLLEWLE